MFLIALVPLACGGDEKQQVKSPGQRLFEETSAKAEVACVGRPLKAGEYISTAEFCINLLSWGFPTDCEAQAFERYPEYQELIVGCLERNHEQLVRCCTNGGPNGRMDTLCEVRTIDACAAELNSRKAFCPELPSFVGEGIAKEAIECAHDDGFDSLGASLLPPVCGKPTVCITPHAAAR